MASETRMDYGLRCYAADCDQAEYGLVCGGRKINWMIVLFFSTIFTHFSTTSNPKTNALHFCN